MLDGRKVTIPTAQGAFVPPTADAGRLAIREPVENWAL
jgi:hypothetical protein